VRILIIGLGSIGKKHINAILYLYPDAYIYALRSSNHSEPNDKVISINKLNEINYSLDFIIISNPTFLHEEFILKSLYFKCPLFIEKPVLHSLKNSEIILSEICRSGIKTYIGCNMRFHPCIIHLKNYFNHNKNLINEINVYYGSYLPNWRNGVDYRNIYSSHSKMGGGVHLDLIHEIDYCIWIFGKPNEIKKTFRKISQLEIDSYDYANYVLVYNDFTINIILNYYRLDSKRTIEVITNKNTINYDLINNKIFDNSKNILYSNNSYSIIQTYIDQIQYFVQNIDSDIEMMNNFEESINILKYVIND